jgi:hypothetical protein
MKIQGLILIALLLFGSRCQGNSTNTTAKPAATTKPTAPANNTGHPVEKQLDVDSVYSNEYVFLKLKGGDKLSKTQKRDKILEIIYKNGGDILDVVPKDKNTTLTDFYKMEVMTYMPFKFMEGVIPVKTKAIKSFQNLEVYYVLKNFEEWQNYHEEEEEDKEGGKKNNTTPTVTHPESTHEVNTAPSTEHLIDPHSAEAGAQTSTERDEDRRVLQGSSTYPTDPDDSTKVLIQDNAYARKKTMMANWALPDLISDIYSLLAIAFRCLIFLIQFFLIFVRPWLCRQRSLLFDWTASFASTMIWLQLFILLGLLAHNYGGALNHPLSQMMKASNSIFLNELDKQIFKTVGDKANGIRGAGYWKLAVSGYVPSPILEHWIGSCLFFLALLMSLFFKKKRNRTYNRMEDGEPDCAQVAKEFKTGVILSYMVPLTTSSINCIYACFKHKIWRAGGTLGFIFSVFFLGYYIYFAFKLVKPLDRLNSDMDRYYNHLNFDYPRVVAFKYFPYIEYLTQFFITIVQVLFSNLRLLPLILVLIALVILLVMFKKVKKQKTANRYKRIKSIHLWKEINLLIRILIVVIMLVFTWFTNRLSLPLISGLSMLALILILFNFVGFVMVMFYRISGVGKKGMKNAYPRNGTGMYMRGTADGRSELFYEDELGYGQFGGEDWRSKSRMTDGMSAIEVGSKMSRGSRRGRPAYGDWDFDYSKVQKRNVVKLSKQF